MQGLARTCLIKRRCLEQALRIEGFIIATNRLALMVYEELFKIPPNVILVVGLIIELVGSLEFRPHRRAPALQEFINWVLIFPVHVRLGEHFEVGHKIITRSHVF